MRIKGVNKLIDALISKSLTEFIASLKNWRMSVIGLINNKGKGQGAKLKRRFLKKVPEGNAQQNDTFLIHTTKKKDEGQTVQSDRTETYLKVTSDFLVISDSGESLAAIFRSLSHL